MSIIVENASKRFGDFVAVDDVSITVPDGSLTALLGPSGSGKSTLLRIIAGLESPDSGRIMIQGNDATSIPAQKRNVGSSSSSTLGSTASARARAIRWRWPPESCDG